MTEHPAPDTPLCRCVPPWPALTAVIEGTAYPAEPTGAHTPASALYLAHCTVCGAPYTRPWRRLTSDTRAA
ncbi:hypothetical protein FHS35_009240 [Streptomyces umbrinus]|uniref:hypothetical protein n=1 Tax=Streptomyces umbrinus TaxID=67370 RepID=UPI00167E86D9|nr:hypothetical protein [Streptomyces umbrinus]MCR3732322.1 hypothetical protein [Streptomyces umbrinus]GHH68070.1 hypothetical protein GCM10018775_92360 [Streptomyces umbrinus]